MKNANDFMKTFMTQYYSTYSTNTNNTFSYLTYDNTNTSTYKTFTYSTTSGKLEYTTQYGYSYVYDEVVLKYDNSPFGIKEYMYANNTKQHIFNALLDVDDNSQEFEDHLYSIVLDLLYDELKKDINYFPDFFNYSQTEFNKVIQSIINYYKEEKENYLC